jgi:hypothetical protein
MNTNHGCAPKNSVRLPGNPRGRFEALIHLGLGIVAVAGFWHFQAALSDFVPRASAMAERLRATPAGFAADSALFTNTPGPAVADVATNRPAVGRTPQTDQTGAPFSI